MHLWCTPIQGRLIEMIPKSQKTNENVAGVEGLEPPTHGLEIRCSFHLSYTPVFIISYLLVIFATSLHLSLESASNPHQFYPAQLPAGCE